MSITSLLQSFQRFGVHLGLDRIKFLLAQLDNPHQNIPMIHVGGTNGKGSVCAYLSSILREAGYKVGRYTSPHLIDWTERICINNQPISESELETIIIKIKNSINTIEDIPTQFEIITAAAWVYFFQQKVDIAVIEVGLGGRLDATNVCDRPLATVITSLSREHWQQLGPTVKDIAKEKAGIFKSQCPVVMGQVSDEVKPVFQSRIDALSCPYTWVKPAVILDGNLAMYNNVKYNLPLLGAMQLNNSALAIETINILQNKGWNISEKDIQQGIKNTQWLGRIQWIKWQNNSILIDGAHNPAAAKMLRHYVDTLDKSVIWIMGMLLTKEHDKVFKELLRDKDSLYLVPVPDHSTANPYNLAILAGEICPKLTEITTKETIFSALECAINEQNSQQVIVMAGSLYLIGHFLGHLPSYTTRSHND
ncbi:folylpolyglutamate synthase/dihydrofolate synthase family protein [Crocosphaera sp.]|uniref:bifunctional folylpolyglutamate synthase/dihydrofolate synthase n=1 Tax=Crocosphaera sp. TaxID=2729996 RepID=UPI00260BC161|nr:folylpolyglutamate synthase/dihydrofolate synthase family protein [Crocosphaera sp.]MDJ0581912.1 folylpolyglutamate synthase/dihydrofolate synthase family protein [Crocosphaera sp.]